MPLSALLVEQEREVETERNVRARMSSGSQDGTWIDLPIAYPVIEFRFTRGDEVVMQAAGESVESYGEQYVLVGVSPDGAYGEHFYLYTHYTHGVPKSKNPHVVQTTNIGKRVAMPRAKQGQA